MGKTLIIYKIYPESVEAVKEVEESLKKVKSGELRDLKKEPIGFGLELIKAAFTVAEKDDSAIEKLEKELKSLNGVNEIETETMTLV